MTKKQAGLTWAAAGQLPGRVPGDSASQEPVPESRARAPSLKTCMRKAVAGGPRVPRGWLEAARMGPRPWPAPSVPWSGHRADAQPGEGLVPAWPPCTDRRLRRHPPSSLALFFTRSLPSPQLLAHYHLNRCLCRWRVAPTGAQGGRPSPGSLWPAPSLRQA